jgi:ribosomal-protein-alanine N-acetyltransferase
MFQLRTPRLLLREFKPEDAQGFYELNTDPEVIRYTGDPPFVSVEAARTFIQDYDAYAKHGIGRWAVIEEATGDFVGFCGLKKHEDGEVDLGYRLRRDRWGRGYATEAAQRCIEYAFKELKLKSLIGRVAKDNHSSIRVLEKLGFEREADVSCESLPGWRYRRVNSEGES